MIRQSNDFTAPESDVVTHLGEQLQGAICSNYRLRHLENASVTTHHARQTSKQQLTYSVTTTLQQQHYEIVVVVACCSYGCCY